MSYIIICETDWGYEYVKTVKGTKSLEKYTDPRILSIYASAKAIYKLYEHSECVQIK